MENSKEVKNQICAEFFTKELNRIHGFDYKSKLIDKEAILNEINNTEFSHNIKGAELSMIDYNPTAWVSSVITNSQKKYSSQDLILLLHPNLDHPNPIFNSSDIEKEKLPTNNFKGVYYVIPPEYKVGGEPKSMFLTIKSAFEPLTETLLLPAKAGLRMGKARPPASLGKARDYGEVNRRDMPKSPESS